MRNKKDEAVTLKKLDNDRLAQISNLVEDLAG